MIRIPIVFLLGLLPANCGAPRAEPPKVFAVDTEQAAPALLECLRSWRGESPFPELQGIGLHPNSGKDYLLQTSNGDQIMIDTRIGSNRLIMYSERSPSEEQVEFLSDCASG